LTSTVKTNQGDDIAGTVYKVGKNVHDFKPGDRVAAFHRMFTPSGSYAEYAIAPASTTFFLPPNTSFESGATLPLASMTAALALYQHLGLPAPWNPVPKGKRVALLIYGGSSAVGTFALKFAKLSGLSPIITIAGGGADFVKSVGAADYIVDYRKNNVVADVQKILDDEGVKLYHAFDAISEHDSWKHVIEILNKDGPEPGKITMVDPPEPVVPEWPHGIEFSRVFVSSAYGEPHKWCDEEEARVHRDFAYVFYRFVTPTESGYSHADGLSHPGT
jgi:NADPH:quinone reductase-like Zn-dependent oxidoreductase